MYKGRTFPVDRNRGLSKRFHCYRKNYTIKIKVLMVTKKK
jgi:hypothetical protein